MPDRRPASRLAALKVIGLSARTRLRGRRSRRVTGRRRGGARRAAVALPEHPPQEGRVARHRLEVNRRIVRRRADQCDNCQRRARGT
eukprot:4151823-Prymnesium_polylepis.2